MIISLNKYSSIGSVLVLLIAGLGLISADLHKPDWGFYGHRKINRMAVFTLPPEMMVLFKPEIEYLTAHAVDPDKRRYATKHEAVRHYIDVDHWGVYPFENVPRKLNDALIKFSEYRLVLNEGDTLNLQLELNDQDIVFKGDEQVLTVDYNLAKTTIDEAIREFYYDGVFPITIPRKWSEEWNGKELIMIDKFSEYGILPYFLYTYQNKLTKAFQNRDKKRIIQIAAEIGHYIGDAHVPLHTTENYNGQMTDQVGIHGFWESRLPELFADNEYDFFVGKADFIDNKRDYFWQIVLDSHLLLDEVLKAEKSLSISFPSDKQFCYDERLDRTIRVQCPEYSEAYHDSMNGMVEKRMQEAIKSIGDVWYTSWVEAGQPDLSDMEEVEYSKKEQKELQEQEESFKRGEIKGRKHDN